MRSGSGRWWNKWFWGVEFKPAIELWEMLTLEQTPISRTAIACIFMVIHLWEVHSKRFCLALALLCNQNTPLGRLAMTSLIRSTLAYRSRRYYRRWTSIRSRSRASRVHAYPICTDLFIAPNVVDKWINKNKDDSYHSSLLLHRYISFSNVAIYQVLCFLDITAETVSFPSATVTLAIAKLNLLDWPMPCIFLQSLHICGDLLYV